VAEIADRGAKQGGEGAKQGGAAPSTWSCCTTITLRRGTARARCLPGVFLHQFVHIPWPQSDAWRVLPQELRQEIFEGLLGNDIVAFHYAALRRELPARLRDAA